MHCLLLKRCGSDATVSVKVIAPKLLLAGQPILVVLEGSVLAHVSMPAIGFYIDWSTSVSLQYLDWIATLGF